MDFSSVALWLYAYTVANSVVSTLSNVIGAALCMGGCATFAHTMITEAKQLNISIKYWIKSLYFLVPAILIITVIPSKEDLKFIFGGAAVVSGASAVVNTDGMKQLPDNLMDAANSFLKQLTPEKKETK